VFSCAQRMFIPPHHVTAFRSYLTRIPGFRRGVDCIRLPFDRRCKFYDLGHCRSSNRIARSPIVQFYSDVPNIGNFLPVLGIKQVLSVPTDTWTVKSKIDFGFINREYKCVIIGGAGLLHECFEPFWQLLLRECRLPMIIWGVGVCRPDDEKRNVTDSSTVRDVARRCDLINVRDDITAELFANDDVVVSACPTLLYLSKFRRARANAQRMLFSSHEELVSSDVTRAIRFKLRQIDREYRYTNNIQWPHRGLDDILNKYYCRSNLVVSTRLHGAIIAYGLGIPYVAVAKDEKLRAFRRLYGNGMCIDEPSELPDAISTARTLQLTDTGIQKVRSFAATADRWIRNTIGGTSSLTVSGE
jgi:hypothetical protein